MFNKAYFIGTDRNMVQLLMHRCILSVQFFISTITPNNGVLKGCIGSKWLKRSHRVSKLLSLSEYFSYVWHIGISQGCVSMYSHSDSIRPGDLWEQVSRKPRKEDNHASAWIRATGPGASAPLSNNWAFVNHKAWIISLIFVNCLYQVIRLQV